MPIQLLTNESLDISLDNITSTDTITLTAPNVHVSESMKIGTTTFPINEFDGLYIKTKQVVTENVGRGLKIEGHYAGGYASTGMEAQAYIEGANAQDHCFAGQFWAFGDGSGTADRVAGLMATGTIRSGHWNQYHGLYCAGVTKENGATIGNEWGVFVAGLASWFGGNTYFGPDLIDTAAIPYKVTAEDAWSEHPDGYGITKAMIGAYANNPSAVDAGGVIALGGKRPDGSRYVYGFIKGAREGAGSIYGGYISFFITSPAGVTGRVESANYESFRIHSRGVDVKGATTFDTIADADVPNPPSGKVTEYWNGTNKKWKKSDGSTGIIY
jgi:hypothetical protein